VPEGKYLLAPYVLAGLRHILECRIGFLVLVKEVFQSHAADER
jgi:hypothetical protein